MKLKKIEAMLASIAASQKQTDRLQAKNQVTIAGLLKKTDRTDAQLAELREQQARTDAQIASLGERQAKTDVQLAETDTLLDRVGRKLDKLGALYGGMSNNQGAAVEEFYYNSLKDNPVLQDIHFDIVYKNLTAKKGDIEDEYDIVLLNGAAVYLIEVKYHVSPEDIDRLMNKKAKNFTRLFPQYQDYTRHLGLACFHIHDGVKKQALSQGVNILQRRGEIIETHVATD